jgi:hypothetical protein
MPGPEDLAPLGAHVVGDGFGWCTGQVLFAGGPEVAVIDRPRLIEVVRTAHVGSLAAVLDAVIPRAFAAAEAKQATDGGSNPRFGPIFEAPNPSLTASEPVKTCAVVADRPSLASSVVASLEARSITCQRVEPARDFDGAARALRAVAEDEGPIDGVVVALEGEGRASATAHGWQEIISDHDGILDQLHTDAAWTRAVADYAAHEARPVRIVTLTDAATPGGRSRAQASAQLARVAGGATERRVAAFSVGIEASGSGTDDAAAALVTHLLTHPDAAALAGAELAVGAGWIGLRSHPRPVGTVIYGGPAIPEWFDGTVREIVGVTPTRDPREA